jgi:hypothetical protein
MIAPQNLPIPPVNVMLLCHVVDGGQLEDLQILDAVRALHTGHVTHFLA